VNSEPWVYALVAAGAIATALFLLYATRARRKIGEAPPQRPLELTEKWPSIKTQRTVTPEEIQKAQKNLQTLDIEREILSHAIRRLYEAHAEGKITEEERERLAARYKSRMMKVRDTLSRSESVVALHELEAMQEDLVKLFSERFDDLSEKVEEMRTRLEIEPIKEVPLPAAPTPATARAPSEKEGKKARKRAPPPRKTEAEKRIEEIRAEVEKVLERLGQIEVEG